MSGFCLIRTSSSERRHLQELDAVRQLNTLGFSEVKIKRGPNFSLIMYCKINGTELEFSEDASCDFAFGAGALIYKGISGQRAVAHILGDFDSTSKILDNCIGNFSLIIWKYNQLHILNNKIGSFFVFHDNSLNVISNSFLCLCRLLPRLSFNTHNLFEFVAKGYVAGDGTPFEQCHSLGPGAHLIFENNKLIDESAPPLPPLAFRGSFEDALEVAADLLRRIFSAIVTAYGDDITCALSGGFDSRLMLAFLLDQGVTPALFVYGADNDPDVLVSTAICAGEGFDLRHVDKEAIKVPSPEEFSDLARLNFQSGDGYFYSGIFNNGAELSERCVRSRHSLTLNGGGGEILRVFFQLLDGSYTAKEFVQAYYLDVEHDGFSSQFCRRAFIDRIAIKVGRISGSDREKLDRRMIEWLYPMFRCRSFFGRYESIYNLNGASILPFFDTDIGSFGAGLPVNWKRAGHFEARLIEKIAPRLASYDSVYGGSFCGPVSRKQLAKELLSSSRPPELRHWLWQLQNIMKRGRNTDRYLSQRYVDRVFEDRNYIMAEYFDVPSVTNQEYLNRIYMLEYLAREFAGKLSRAV